MDEKKEYKELYVNGESYNTKLCKKFVDAPKWVKENKGLSYAFIPGTIREIYVKVGQKVEKGESLMILEAMKMRNRVKAEKSGIVKTIHVKENQLVSKNFILVELV